MLPLHPRLEVLGVRAAGDLQSAAKVDMIELADVILQIPMIIDTIRHQKRFSTNSTMITG